jgi:heat shock protein HtpX
MLLSTMVVVLVGFVSILSNIFLRSVRRGGGRSRSNNRAAGVLMLVGVVLAILAPLIATLIRLAISRKREFLADASGALLTRYPEGLALALEKIGAAGQPRLAGASDITAHLFIANPFGSAVQGVHKLFLTHPPIKERIRALREMS